MIDDRYNKSWELKIEISAVTGTTNSRLQEL